MSSLSVPTTPILAIRLATPEDAPAVRRLAALDGALAVPSGDVLVAVCDGEVRAAMPVAGGRPIADPFHPTAELVAHLRLRAARLRGATVTGTGDRHARRLAALMPRAARTAR